MLLQSLGPEKQGLAEDAAEAPEECTPGEVGHSSELKAKEAPEPVVAELRARALPSAVSTELPQQLSSSTPPAHDSSRFTRTPPAPRPPLEDAPALDATQAEELMLLPPTAEGVTMAVVVAVREVLVVVRGTVRPEGLVVGQLGCCWACAWALAAPSGAVVAFTSAPVADEGCLADVLGCWGHGQGAQLPGVAPQRAPELVCGLALRSVRGGLCRESGAGATQLPSKRRHRVVVVMLGKSRAAWRAVSEPEGLW